MENNTQNTASKSLSIVRKNPDINKKIMNELFMLFVT